MSTTHQSLKFGFLIALAAGLLASPTGAQSWGDETTTTTPPARQQPRARSTSAGLIEGNRGYRDAAGPYVQFGAAVGAIELDDIRVGRRKRNADSDASGGFTMTGGYRVNAWIAAEANITFMGGGDVEVGNTDIGEAEAFAFSFGPKFYPMGLLDRQPIPEWFQPYFLIGIGGGEAELDVKGGGRDIERSSFTARFIPGFDIWFTDNIGAFMEGGYHVWDDDAVDGVGLFSFGAQYRF